MTAARASSLIIAGFFLLLFAFHQQGMYHRHFFDTGPGVVAYQLMRILFVPYLLWLQYAVGARITRHPIAACLAGSAVWHIVLFILGLAGLITAPVMLGLSGLVMLSSWKLLTRAIKNRPSFPLRGYALLAILAGFAFLFIKGAYPSGGSDFYTMYYPYYMAVLRDGALGPNELWYQYFYGKGAGLFFLSMLLLDPLAMHLATMSLVLVASAIVYDWVAQAGGRRLGWFAVFLYFACYMYTPASGIFEFTGGWGELEKTHELVAVFLLGILWLIGRKDNGPALALCGVAITIISLESGFIVGLVLVLAMLADRRRWKPLFLAASATGVTLLLHHLINYLATGIPSMQAVVPAFGIISWPRIVELGTSLELYILWNGMVKLAPLSHTTLGSISFLGWSSLRLFLLWPFFAATAVLWIVSRRRSTKIAASSRPLFILILATLITLGIATGSEALSFFRFTSFTYAPMLILAMLLWAKFPHRHVAMLLATTLLPLFAFLPAKARDDWKNLLSAAWHFNTGQYSLADATTDLRGRAKDFGGKLQLSGNHPAFREIYEILPPKTRIWSFSNIAYCMLPACNIGRQSADITATRWYELPAASIEQGRALLQSEGKNYFFYSTIIPDNHYADTKDVLAALYPGLHPEHINDTFGIAWTNGTDYLLTWKSPATHPLDNNFLTSWSRYHRESVALREHYFSTVALAPYIAEAVKNHQLKHPLRIE